MRRVLSAATAVLLTAGVMVAASEGVADASVTSPSSGSVLRGTVTLSDSGGTDNSSILGVKHCGSSVHTTLQLINSANTVVFSQVKDGAGSFSVSVLTESYPNGSYKVRGIDGNGANSGFGGFGCTTQNVTQDVPVTIDNVVSIAYSGVTSAPQNTSATVSATLTDPNLSPAELGGRQLSFALSGGATVNATTNAGGVATASLPVNGPPRSATLNVTFAATSFYGAKTQSITFTVGKDATATTLAAPAPVVHGQTTSFTATVAATQGTGTPTGSVQFTLDGANFGSAVPLAGGSATTPAALLTTGSHTVGAQYSGDGNFLASTASSVGQTVAKASTTTTLGSAPNPSVTGQGVSFTASVAVVAPGAGTPSGGVQFFVDGNPFGTAVALTGTSATLTVSSLHTGNHAVTATYNGDSDFASSDSALVTQGVNKADTSVGLSSSDSPSVTGQPVSFTADVAAVAPGAGTPTGTVQFAVDGVELGAPVPLVDGSATSPAIATLVPGSHAVTANYAGDDGFSGQSTSFNQVVDQAATTAAVSSTVNPSVFGQPVTFHAAVAVVAPGAGIATGSVQFFVDGVAVGTPVALVAGAADSAPIADLPVGDHAVSVAYSGDNGFRPASSDAITQTVNKAPTAVSVTSSANPSVFGQTVTFEAQVSVPSPGAGTPAGSVSFTFTGVAGVFTAALDPTSGGTVQISTSILPVGQTVATATYNGDGNFLGSSDSVAQTVQRAQTSTVLTSSANPAQSGQAVTFSATVTPVAPGAGDPGGTVVFRVNGAQLGAPAAVVAGVATSTSFASLSPGTYAITATYSGDRNFVGSNASLDQGNGLNVTKGATSASLTAGPNPAAYGAPVTFTATVTAVAPATGRPSGVVQFYEGSVLLGASSLAGTVANTAAATFVSTSLTPGSHSVRAVYVGNFNFAGATASADESVGQVGTITGVESAANPSVFGAAVVLTAVVAANPAAAGDPTGTVTFKDGTAILGTADLSTQQGRQQASLSVPGLAAGSHGITAVYGGSTEYAGSTSPVFTQNVNRAPSTVEAATLITYHNPGGFEGNGGVVRATLTGVNGAPLAGQTLVFTTTQSTDHSVIHICDAVTGADGVASCDATALILAIDNDGGYDVNFAGNASYLPSHDHGTQF
ncbi:MAG: hypothetical protein QOE97_1343 [Pseudonocardiales bacterium]|nr:hypothetical protein [Pseudonocardiales bacterium]